MVETRQQAGFIDETDQPGRKRLAMACGSDADRKAVGLANRQRLRHELLERDRSSERIVLCQVNVAKRTNADQAGDLKLALTRSRRQGIASLRSGCGHRLPSQPRAGADDCFIVIFKVGHG
jgi:hypothetical protein